MTCILLYTHYEHYDVCYALIEPYRTNFSIAELSD